MKPILPIYSPHAYMNFTPLSLLTFVFDPDKWLAMQSLDNQILIYSSDSFKQNRKKRFAGHTIAGYACEVGFSPDGQYLSSGDGSGNMIFWDWKTCRITKRLRCHDQVVISHAWLPHETVSYLHQPETL